MWLANETLERTDLGEYGCPSIFDLYVLGDAVLLSTGQRKAGDEVNLERAMGAHVRFGGHFVQVPIFVLLENEIYTSYILSAGTRRYYGDVD